MVVNRKQPAAPVPLIQSRSTSQQIITRKKQSKLTTSSNVITSHKPPSTNPDTKLKSTSPPRPRKRYLPDKSIFWFLILFGFYSFLICSPYTTTFQHSNSHLICRAESNYKVYILDPFILPPLKHSFSFTHSLAKPYISQANAHLEPYLAPVNQVTSTVKPYVTQTATTAKRVWKGTLIPFYKNTLKPYYQSAIVPRYNIYLRPLVAHFQRYYAYYISNPIRIQSNRVQLHLSNLYITRIHTHVSHLQPYIHTFVSALQTTYFSTIGFYTKHVQPTLLFTWIRVQPHLSCAFDQVKNTSLNAAAGTTKYLKGLANQVGAQRRTYVDPHIHKIWDKVEENTTAKMTTAICESENEAEPLTSNTDATPSGIDNLEPESTEAEAVQAETEATIPVTSTPSAQQEESSAESILQASLHASTTPTPAAGGVIGVSASSPSASTSAEDDLDDFLRDIGMDTSSPSPTPTQPSETEEAAASTSVFAEEDEVSRLAAIASKRLAITTRHTQYEGDLQASILTSTSQVIETLNEMRKAKKEELIGLIEGGGETEGLVVELTWGGERLMKGLEVYLNKCRELSRTWKERSVEEDEEDIQKRTGLAKDEQIRLESVVEKVEMKFLDVLNKLQEQVTGWYSGVVHGEQEEVFKIKTAIKNMAEKAQANLGLDYAWLEDVTYLDWQRYHDLARASEKFEKTAYAIQDGTSLDPPSPPNPIKPVINELQKELQTVVLGFHVALKNVKDTIPELFSIGGSVGGEDDKVRIQPIDPDVGDENGEKARQGKQGFDASKIIIGKSKEQVEQALKDVPLAEHVHEEL